MSVLNMFYFSLRLSSTNCNCDVVTGVQGRPTMHGEPGLTTGIREE